MSRLTRRYLTPLLLPCLFGVLACGPEAPAEPSTESEPAQEEAVREVPVEEEEEEEVLDEEAPPSISERDIEAMTRGELEAACYAGSTTACDALGH